MNRQASARMQTSSPNIEMCEMHADKKVEHYCVIHAELLCRVCKDSHRKCNDVTSLTQAAGRYHADESLEKMKDRVGKFGTELDERIRLQTNDFAMIEANKNEVKASIYQYFETVHNYIDTIKRNVDKEVDTIAGKAKSTLKDALRKYSLLEQDLNKFDESLNITTGLQQKSQSFIVMKRAETHLKKLESDKNLLEENAVVCEMKFKPDDHLQSLTRTLEQLGQFVMKNVVTDIAETPDDLANYRPLETAQRGNLNTRTLELTASPDGDLNVHTEEDSGNCCVSSCSLLDDGETLAVADSSNEAVKLVHVKRRQVMCEIRLRSWPWDLTQAGTNRLAVTLPRARTIQFLSIRDSALVEAVAIGVNGECRGIECSDDKLFVTFTAPLPQVQILSGSTGSVLQSFSTYPNRQPLFKKPFYVTVSKDRANFFVSDFEKHTVFCLTLNNDVKGEFVEAEYRDDALKGPRQVAITDDGLIYVCGQVSSNVHVVTADGAENRILLEQSNGVNNPYSVAFCKVLDLVFVGMLNSNAIKIFSLETDGSVC